MEGGDSSSSFSSSTDFSNSSSFSSSTSEDIKIEIPLEVSADDIELGKLIAESNFGKVYKGRCHSQPVAIKMLHGKLYESMKDVMKDMKVEVDIMRYKFLFILFYLYFY